MVLRAARDLNLDLPRSWFVGDILDDIEAGARAGCRTVLVDLGTEAAPSRDVRRPTYVARDTPHALAIIRGAEGLGPTPDTTYRPASWDSPASDPTSAAPGAVNRARRSAWLTQ
jgi:D-glycero-D-manno-heptose 1,7-bisphosphate phosphatase